MENNGDNGAHPLFVYGTLLPNQPNFYLWGDTIIGMETAVFKNGRLYDMGHYPMLIEEPGNQVHGKIITVKSDFYPLIVARLDNLEGYNPQQPQASAYQRKKRLVRLVDGRFINAWVYIGQPQYVKGLPIVETKDWSTHAANEIQLMQKWWATTDSVAGLHEADIDNP
ncbi:MAG: gamma-glutamylcyclotransferase [Chloroflexi bacterium]|nr:gamma-glutamylcyclotransferase [Chloroflexota bacterium]